MLELWTGRTLPKQKQSTQERPGKWAKPLVAAHTAGQGRARAKNRSMGGWSKPKKPSPGQPVPPSAPTAIKNRFRILSEEESKPGEREQAEEPNEKPDPPPKRKNRTRKKTKKSSPVEQDEEAPTGPEIKLLERPHRSTWFLPGRIRRVPVQILMDTACTTNLMSKAVFDKLDRATKDSVEPCEAFGTLADGRKLRFHGMVKTNLRILYYRVEETFVIGQSD